MNRMRWMTGWSISAACAAMAILGGCSTLGQDQQLLSRDMYEVRQQLGEFMKQQESIDNKVTYSLGSIDENLQSNGQIVQNAIDGLQKQLRDQQEEMNQLRGSMEAMMVTLDSLSRRMGVTPAGSATGGSQPGITSPGDSAQPGQAPAPTGPATTAADQAYQGALQQFNMGRYEQAREGFMTALSQNPTNEQKVDILYWLGETIYQLGDKDTAFNTFSQIIDVNQQSQQAWRAVERMGDIRMEQGRKEDALVEFQKFSIYQDYPNIDRVNEKMARLR